MKKVVLVNLSYLESYKDSKVRVGVPILPPYNLAILGGSLSANNIDIRGTDFTVESMDEFRALLTDYQPDYVAIGVMTPSTDRLKEVIQEVRRLSSAKVVLGGPHANGAKDVLLAELKPDAILLGEADNTLPKLVNEGITQQIYKEEAFLAVEDLPMPAWQIFKLDRYTCPELVSRQRPVAPIETSRGCPFLCTYCAKTIYGPSFRPKSAEKVVQEIEHGVKHGFKEFHIIDDGFSTNLVRAKKICDMLIKLDLGITWNVRSGMRADRSDEELFRKMKQAGCYRASFGVESGSQEILDKVKKGIKLETIEKAFKTANKVGLETLGFFMIGLPGDNEENMKKTLAFAKKINPYIAKLTVFHPLPGTELYSELKDQNRIQVTDFSKYNYENETPVFKHPTTDWKVIRKNYNKFYRSFYLRPSYIARRAVHDAKTGQLKSSANAFFNIKWF
jgi:anaerobic magnesium-protoporphyrin IX monomethyl ester cyclase